MLLLAGAGFAGAPAARAAPTRVVSLNPCLDTILVHLTDASQIAALSHYAREKSSSSIAEEARRLPFTYETAEEILAMRPDLVLASQHSALATRNALARLGVAVSTFGVPKSVEESIEQVAAIAGLIGREAEGRALIARIQAALADLGTGGATPIRALVFQPRGLVAGEGTLPHEMMTRAGFENVAARYGVNYWGSVPLEHLLADPPDLLLESSPPPGAKTASERMMGHPALKAIAGRMRRAEFPEACFYCGGPVLIQTAAVLKRARDAHGQAT
jgi:iron complex transport system substrate-binding protein